MESHLDRHQKIVGYIFIILGFLSLAFGVIMTNAFIYFQDWFWSDSVPTIDLGLITIHNPFRWLLLFPIIKLVFAALKISSGFGILAGKKWAHKLALVIGFFWFFSFPLGTIFSIYIFYAFLERNGTSSVNSNQD